MINLVASLFAAHAAAPPPIVNGEVTTDFLPVGAITAEYGGVDYAFCSGTLIDERWVLTAAHCSVFAKTYQDQGYEISFQITSDVADSGATEERAVVDLIEHDPEYNDQTLINDVGLIRLDRALSTEPYPLSEDTPSLTWLEEDLRFVGFGVTSYQGTGGGLKRTADLPVADVNAWFIITYDEEGQNACSGDSGGAALRILGDDQYELVGAISFVFTDQAGADPCTEGGAGVARLDQSRAWVEEVMAEYGVEEPEDTSEAPTEEEEDDVISSTPSTTHFQEPTGGGCSVGGRGAGGSVVLLTASLLSLFRRRRGRV